MRDLRQPPSAGQGGPRPVSPDDPFDPADRRSRFDLFLSPHADDVCFSLGALAFRRRAGTLATIFPVSGHLAPSQRWRTADSAEITRLRMAEDATFAGACGLAMRGLGFDEAPIRGRTVFDLAPLEEETKWIEGPLLAHLAACAGPATGDPADRPWLFCPIGIGGHLDHALIQQVVTRHVEALRRVWRIGFYEDLFYASDPLARFTGLHRLMRVLPGFRLKRRSGELGQMTATKLDLIRGYASQFDELPMTIDAFTPATGGSAAAHEAIWTIDGRA